MQDILQKALERLIGLQFSKATRQEALQYFHFGHTHYTTPQGLVLDVGELTLAVNCPWQLQLPDGGVVRHSDVYIRKREAGLPNPVWDWKVPGSNLRDQRLQEFIHDNPNLSVQRAEQQQDLSLIFHLEGGATLTILPNPTQAAAEYWQLFSNTGDGLRVGAGESGLL